MKNSCLIISLWLTCCMSLFSHGQSEEMRKILNAPLPEWLFLGEKIKVEITEKDLILVIGRTVFPIGILRQYCANC